ncbi:hypothetical protein [Jeotgalibacillus soli]|uniref:Uncharacterized protein n=1 Tax=Jeotgalibacillus soli TaxID=889306 RepID=A0A0C2V9Z6_9BACL|nr:hypothetical protein [Jeotgalibacillus soli]KIL45787.1 hypothetical protein KP78_21360 [Jeotgalibacillus soli]
MLIENLIEMLKTISYYRDCKITHTFSQNHLPVAMVCYLPQINSYQVTFFESGAVELYSQEETAAIAINGVLNKELEESH